MLADLDSTNSVMTQSTISNASLSPDFTSLMKSEMNLPKTRIVFHRPVEKKKTKRQVQKKIIKHYFTKGSNVRKDNQRDVQKESSPFSYPKDLEEFAHKVLTKAWRSGAAVGEMQMKCVERPNFRSRQRRDLLNRLYVEDPPNDSMKTILNLNPNFYKVIEGRPIEEKLELKNYIQTLRDILKSNIVNGYRQDEIIMIEENLLLEQRTLEDIKKRYMMYVNAFEEFLFIDHTTSMSLLKQSEKDSSEAYVKYEAYKELSKNYGSLRSVVYILEEKWRNCKMYQNFLDLVSPISWRKEKGLYSQSQEFQQTEDVDTVFGKYRTTDDEKLSLTDLVDQFLEDSASKSKPLLYFSNPEQLVEVFKFMEIQNLNSLLHSEELANPLQTVREGMENAEQLFQEEIKNLLESIEKLESGIAWEEERSSYLQQLGHDLIENQFKKLVVDENILSLHVYVEDVFETVIGPNDANLSVIEMMKAIENRYRSELLLLDKLPSELVSRMEGECYREQQKIMRMADKAQKQFLELQNITYRLARSFAPRFRKEGKEPKNRSPPINPPKPVPPPPRDLTKEEYEFLDLFTDFCKQSDNPNDFGIDTTPLKKESTVELQEGETELL